MKIASALLCLFLYFSATAQNVYDDTSSTIVAYWKKGETKTYNIQRTKEQFAGSKKVKSASNSYEAQMKVLDSTKSNYTIEWTYQNIVSKGTDELTNTLANLTKGLKVIYKTDDVGSFEEVVNLKEIQSFVNKSIDLLLTQNTDSNLVAISKQVKVWLNSKEAIESLILKEIQLYHTPFGNELSINSKVTQEVDLPNITGGAPFPAVIEVGLSKLEPEKDFCQVFMNQKIDKIKGNDIFLDVIKKLAGPALKELSDKDIPSQIDISDHYEFDVLLSTGWLSRVYLKRTAKVLDTENIETYQITLKN